jgi:hypothetical protein
MCQQAGGDGVLHVFRARFGYFDVCERRARRRARELATLIPIPARPSDLQQPGKVAHVAAGRGHACKGVARAVFGGVAHHLLHRGEDKVGWLPL